VDQKNDYTDKEIVQEILECFLKFGRSLKAIFAPSVVKDLIPLVMSGRKQLIKVFYEFFYNRPNLHIAVHFEEQADLFEALKNCQVSSKEMNHRKGRAVTKKSNYHGLEKTMAQRENYSSTMKFVLKGGKCPRRTCETGQGLLSLKDDPLLSKIMVNWIFEQEEDDYEPHKGRTAVKFDKNSKFEKDLSLAHKALDGILREISHFTVQPFDSIDITKKGKQMNIQEGVFVEIYLGDQIGIALVKTVFAHKGLDGNADFFIDIEWLKLRRKDPSTGFEIYIPTKLDSFNKPWQTIFPINSIMSTVSGTLLHQTLRHTRKENYSWKQQRIHFQ